MTAVTADNFGFLIAYLLPGFLCVWGFRPYFDAEQLGLASPSAGTPTVGGFLYGTLASLAAGLMVSALRWAVVDRLYHRTGIPPPRWDFRKLAGQLGAFEGLVANHYRFFQFYANSLTSIALVSAVGLVAQRRWPGQDPWTDAFVLGVCGLLVVASRDTLRKYYRRVDDLLCEDEPPLRRRAGGGSGAARR